MTPTASFQRHELWWTFRASGGHDDTVVLDGGLLKWRSEGRSLESGWRTPVHGDFKSRPGASLVRTLNDVRDALATGGEQILDGRPAARFTGVAAEGRATAFEAATCQARSTCPGRAWVRADGTLLPAAALRDAFQAAGVRSRRADHQASCGSGRSAPPCWPWRWPDWIGAMSPSMTDHGANGARGPIHRWRLEHDNVRRAAGGPGGSRLSSPEIERSAAAAFHGTDLLRSLDGLFAPAAVWSPALATGTLWVAEKSAGEVVGFLAATRVDAWLHIDEIDVASGHQGQGLGRKMMQAAIAWAAERDLVGVTLTTFRDVRWNAPFYASLGSHGGIRRRLLSPALVAHPDPTGSCASDSIPPSGCAPHEAWRFR